jgi:molybdopterin-binding protein
MTISARNRLEGTVGMPTYAVVKASDVMVAVDG